MSNDISRKLNELKNIARFGKHPYMNLSKDAAVKMFGTGENTVSFIAVGTLKEFDKITAHLYKYQSRISDNYSLIYFINELVDLLRYLHKENREAQKNDWDHFAVRLLNREDLSVHILAPIYGLTMISPTVRIGEFIIYNPSHILQILKTQYPDIPELTDNKSSFDDNFKIGITVKAKDIDKCYQLAEKAFQAVIS